MKSKIKEPLNELWNNKNDERWNKMTDKLKTLKDLGEEYAEVVWKLTTKDKKTLQDLKVLVSKKELRQKAIKWIKEDIKLDDGVMWRTRTWMHRFNITEEDLK